MHCEIMWNRIVQESKRTIINIVPAAEQDKGRANVELSPLYLSQPLSQVLLRPQNGDSSFQAFYCWVKVYLRHSGEQLKPPV